jgi:putative ABC transport system permease protein
VPAFLIQLSPSKFGPFPFDVSANLYVATPELLRYYGLGPAATGPGTEVLTPHRADDLSFFGGGDETRAAKTAPLRRPAYQSLPDGLLTPEALRRHGLTAVRVGWLIETDRPLTTAQLAAARDLALDNGLVVESRDTGPPRAQIRGAATAAGGVLALGVLAMTVGLIRGEARRDLRILTATGATRRIRRTLGPLRPSGSPCSARSSASLSHTWLQPRSWTRTSACSNGYRSSSSRSSSSGCRWSPRPPAGC